MRRAGGARLAPLLLLLGGGPAVAQEEPLDVERRGPAVVEGAPSEAVNVPFSVVNSGAAREEVRPEVELPPAWTLVTGEAPLELEPESSALRLVSVRIPGDAPPGRSAVRFRAARSSRAPPRWVGDSVSVEVQAREELSLGFEGMPERIPAGESYRGDLLLRNEGNVPAGFRLEAESSRGYPVDLEASVIRLDPGEAVRVAVAAHSDPDLARERREILEVRAIEPSTDEERATASTGLDVVPRAAGDGSVSGAEWHRLPVRARVSTASPVGGVAPVEIAASGPLFDTGADRIDLLLRGPEPSVSALGHREEYRLTYRNDWMSATLGDQVYSLTRLAERGYSAFGAGLEAELGNWRLGGHHAGDRRLDGDTQTAARLGYALGASSLDVSYLARNGEGAGLWTLRGRTRPLPGSKLEVEYGQGVGEASQATGTSAELSGRLPFGRYRFSALRTDPDLPTRHQGLDERYGTVTIEPWSDLRLRAHARYSERTAGSTEDGPARGRSSWAYGGGIAYGRYASLEFRGSGRSAPARSPAVVTESVRLGLGWSLGGWTFRPSLRADRTLPGPREHGDTSDAMGHRIGMRASYRAGGAGSVSLSGERFAKGGGGGAERERGFTGRVSASGSLSGRTRFRLSLVGSLSEETGEPRHGLVDATVTHRLFSGHELEARVRALARHRIAGSRAPAFVLSYMVPFEVPVSVSRERGRIAGRIVDVESGEGRANMLVRVAGRSVLTGAAGGFEVNDLEPGPHRIEVDPVGSTGLVPVEDDVLNVRVEEGREVRLDIEVVPSASLSGGLRRFEPAPGARPDDPDPDLVDAAGISGATVELTRGSETHRRVTDSRGRFAFTGIHPGTWTLTVDTALPDWHRLESDSMQIHLPPGGERETLVRVIPVRRNMRMIPADSIRDASEDHALHAPPSAAHGLLITGFPPTPSRPYPEVAMAVPSWVIRTYDEPLTASTGTSYVAKVCGRARADGMWEGWVEFVPEGGSPVLRSHRETTQPDRNSVEGWAARLSRTYLQGALERTVREEVPSTGVPTRSPERPRFEGPAPRSGLRRPAPDDAAVNPFLHHAAGDRALLEKLGELSAAELRTVIRAFDLDQTEPIPDIDALDRPKLMALVMRAVRLRSAE